MTWPEVKNAVEVDAFVLIPAGATEEHGPHLALGTDHLIASEVAIRAARKAREMGVDVVVAPTLSIGFSGETMFFPGSISLQPETLVNLILDVCRSLIKHGFKKLIIVNAHGGQVTLVDMVCRKIRDETENKVIVGNALWPHLAEDVINQVRQTPPGTPDHGGEIETSVVLYLRPDLIRKDKMVPMMKKIPILAEKNFAEMYPDLAEYRVAVPMPRFETISENLGHLGDPTLATAEKGKQIIETASARLAGYMKKVKEKGFFFGVEMI